MTARRSLPLLLLPLLLAAPGALAQEAEEKELHAWGKLDPVRGAEGTSLLRYVDRSGERPRKAELYLTVAADARFLVDRITRLDALEEGQEVWVLGQVVEQDTTTQEGRTITDRQITNAQAVVAGEAVAPHAERPSPRDPELRWVKATVVRPGKSPSVTYEGAEYRLSCARQHVVVLRQRLAERPPLKRGALVEVRALPAGERPEGAQDPEVPAARAREVVVLDKRLARALYPLLLP